MKIKTIRFIGYFLVIGLIISLTVVTTACGGAQPASTTKATSTSAPTTNIATVTTSAASSTITTTNGTPTGVLTSIAVTPAIPPSLHLGGSQDFKAIANYSDGSSVDITAQAKWASFDPSVAVFLQAGSLLTGMKVGSTTITATLEGKTSLPVSVTVIPLPF